MAKPKNVKKKSGTQPFYGILAVVALVGIAAIAWVVMRDKKSAAADAPVVVEGADDPQALVAKATGIIKGSDNAPAKMLVFSDFQCPACAAFSTNIEPLLADDINSGKLQYVYYDFPLGGAHKYAFLAGRAGRCAADQNKFWEYHDVLFGKQSDWAFAADNPVKEFVEYGSLAGLNQAEFETCVKSDKHQEVVSANHMLGERLGVNSTPTVFINGKRVPSSDVQDIKVIREMINSSAGAAPTAPAAPTTTAQ